jgi:putative peptidoglycan lipid II flippase
VPGTRLVWTTPPTATSFDPEGNGTEDPGGVGLALDDDPSTAWTTDTYHGSPQFGGLKQGVGLLVDLGRPKTVHTARLLLSAPGADIELRAGQNPPATADALPLVASRNASPASLTLQLTSPVRARYWLVWITSLPRVGSDSYSLGVEEVALLR